MSTLEYWPREHVVMLIRRWSPNPHPVGNTLAVELYAIDLRAAANNPEYLIGIADALLIDGRDHIVDLEGRPIG